MVLTTAPWDLDRRDAAMARGSHASTAEHHAFLRVEMADMVNKGFWVVLPYALVRTLPGLRLSPIGIVPQRDRRPRTIVDYTFSFVNQETLRLAPREAMQFGHALHRVLRHIRFANAAHGPVYMLKVDIADGFYRVYVAPRDVPKLGVAFPHHKDEEPLVGFPLSLPMGWTESVPYFTSFTETVADIANDRLQDCADPSPHRLDTTAATNPPPPADGRLVYQEGDHPLALSAPLPSGRRRVAPLATTPYPRRTLSPSGRRRVAPLATTPSPRRTYRSTLSLLGGRVAHPAAEPLSGDRPCNNPPHCPEETLASLAPRRGRISPPNDRRAAPFAATRANGRDHCPGPRLRGPTLRPPLQYIDIFVDDAIGCGQGTPARLQRIRRILMGALDDVFRPLSSADPISRQEPASVKKMLKGDACWTTLKTVLGWLIDTVRGTIELPPHRLLRVRELFDLFRGRKRVALKQWHQLLGELRSMTLAIPGGTGMFSHLQNALRHSDKSRVKLNKDVHNQLADFEHLTNNLGERPTRIAEVVPAEPSHIGACDAARGGMGASGCHPVSTPRTRPLSGANASRPRCKRT